MEKLKGFYELLRETYGPFFPSSKAKKEAFLGKVREKVEYYKPRIEEACEVDMENIHVKYFKYWVRDFTRDKLQEKFEKYSEREGKEPSRFVKGIIVSSFFSVRITAEPLVWLFMSLFGAGMKHYKSSIYVPFYFKNRFTDIDFERREKGLDQAVVHELSHKLWYCLGGDETEDSNRNWRLWSEGFASYCSDIHFADLYPENFEVHQHRDFGIHQRGKEKVEELVEKYGKDIILKVPKRWKEFNSC